MLLRVLRYVTATLYIALRLRRFILVLKSSCQFWVIIASIWPQSAPRCVSYKRDRVSSGFNRNVTKSKKFRRNMQHTQNKSQNVIFRSFVHKRCGRVCTTFGVLARLNDIITYDISAISSWVSLMWGSTSPFSSLFINKHVNKCNCSPNKAPKSTKDRHPFNGLFSRTSWASRHQKG